MKDAPHRILTLRECDPALSREHTVSGWCEEAQCCAHNPGLWHEDTFCLGSSYPRHTPFPVYNQDL